MTAHPCSACNRPVDWTPREEPTHDCDGREAGYPCECGHFERAAYPDGGEPDDRSDSHELALTPAANDRVTNRIIEAAKGAKP